MQLFRGCRLRREVKRQRVEIGITGLGLSEKGHHAYAIADELLHDLRREVRALLEHGGLAALVESSQRHGPRLVRPLPMAGRTPFLKDFVAAGRLGGISS